MPRRGRRFLGRIERVLLGAVFGLVAFVIERRVLKAIKRGHTKSPKPAVGDGKGKGLVVTPEKVQE